MVTNKTTVWNISYEEAQQCKDGTCVGHIVTPVMKWGSTDDGRVHLRAIEVNCVHDKEQYDDLFMSEEGSLRKAIKEYQEKINKCYFRLKQLEDEE